MQSMIDGETHSPRIRSGLIALLLVVLLAPAARLVAQEPATESDARLRALEERLRDHEALKARVADLEARLDRYAQAGIEVPDDSLDRMVNNLLARGVGDGSVFAAKSAKLGVSGQLRFRLEWRAPFDYRLPGTFGRPATQSVHDDNDRVEQRTRVQFDARVLDDLRAFVQIEDSRLWGEELSALADTEGVDIHQAYVDIEKAFGAPLTFRIGRQELSYGDQRLISPLDWSNIARAWDGVRVWYQGETFSLDAFATDVREAVNGVTDEDDLFNGLYFSYTGWDKHWLDVYFLQRLDHSGNSTAESGKTGDRTDYFVGGRFKGAASGFDYSAEGTFEFGDQAGDDISAFGTAVTAGYTFDASWKPRLGLEWTFGSGDSNPADGKIGTFDPPYPLGHMYQGWMDVFSWKNGHDVALHFSVKPDDAWTVGIWGHYFLLDEERDAWFNAAKAPIRRDKTGSSGSTVGEEIDLYAKWVMNANLQVFFGYSHFFTDDFVHQTGPDPDQNWIWAMLTVDF